MIDWINLASNALWIVGLALALATFSYASWEASLRHQKLRERLRLPAVQFPLDLAGVLFCAGLAATSGRLYEVVLWVILGIAFAVQAVIAVLASRRRLKT
jgi:presenilin-like A22 family membrane protease